MHPGARAPPVPRDPLVAMALALAVAAVLTVAVSSQTMDPRVYNGSRRHPADSPATLGGSVAVIPCSGGYVVAAARVRGARLWGARGEVSTRPRLQLACA